MRLRVITFIAAVLVFITFLTSALFAQSSEQVPAPVAKRPTIGLVLEGGGALGLAHVGVIQWLEEHRIPVSYIAGTSMGGLVGGVYATGRNAQQVTEVVDSIHWNQVMSGQTPFDDLSFGASKTRGTIPAPWSSVPARVYRCLPASTPGRRFP